MMPVDIHCLGMTCQHNLFCKKSVPKPYHFAGHIQRCGMETDIFWGSVYSSLDIHNPAALSETETALFDATFMVTFQRNRWNHKDKVKGYYLYGMALSAATQNVNTR